VLSHAVTASQRGMRKIARVPYKVLDAPQLGDDYYLNLLDWSSTNVIAVALGASVYLYTVATAKVTRLVELNESDGPVASVAWSSCGQNLAVGTTSGALQIWDTGTGKKLRVLRGHKLRVASLAWRGISSSSSGCGGGSYGGDTNVMMSGSRDRTILWRDLRTSQNAVGLLAAHAQEVCGLQWSPDETQLASGGNDNRLFVWDTRGGVLGGSSGSVSSSPSRPPSLTTTANSNPTVLAPRLRLEGHQAAVRAIGWSPHQRGLLVSGGGTSDRCLRFWNTLTDSTTSLASMDTGSQVCSLAWSSTVNELVTTHGYSQNQVVVWRYPSLTKVAMLTGHTSRVLHLSLGPTGENIVTGAGDETLRFWSVFPPSTRRMRYDSAQPAAVSSAPLTGSASSPPSISSSAARLPATSSSAFSLPSSSLSSPHHSHHRRHHHHHSHSHHQRTRLSSSGGGGMVDHHHHQQQQYPSVFENHSSPSLGHMRSRTIR